MNSSGERFLPHASDPFDEIAVEHLQRYYAISGLLRGKTVLDAGSGEGYGTHMLSGSAARVVGVDISPDAVDEANSRYRRSNLEYRLASIEALPFTDASFDVVVSFEVIEHVDEKVQEAFLGEVRRVLKNDGIFIVSTPNKAVYTDDAHHHNRFHKKEFYIDEFETFLRRFFPRISIFGQSWFVSSILSRASSLRFHKIALGGEVPFAPKYVLAVCGNGEGVDMVDLSSAVVDGSGRFESIGKRIQELQEEVAGKNRWAGSLEQQIENLGQVVAHYRQESADFQERVIEAHKHIEVLDERLRREAATIAGLEVRISCLKADVESLLSIIREREAELDAIKQSDFWKLASRYWQFRDEWFPAGSRRRRMLKGAFRNAKKGARWIARSGRSTAQPETGPGAGAAANPAADDSDSFTEPIQFTVSDGPKVSIIVPVYNQWAHTYRCMKSLRKTIGTTECEIILADDGSSDTTTRAEEILIGVRVLRDGINRGFLRNCNWAAGRARGEYLHFLNNDTELRAGAVQSLIALLDRDPGIGIAGSKFVSPDGKVLEAGGIIWADGTGWNYGRGQDPSLPAFNYLKETDYVSGASLMIRSAIWKEIGGFDERYAPAYCEDSDLAFEVRKRGWKVVYQPQSVVVHYEGASHGTDVTQDTKACQVRNTEILMTKWQAELAGHLPHGTDLFHARDRSVGRKSILMIDHYIPQFDKDAGSRTIWSFIEAFLRLGMNVKFLGDNFFPHQPYTDLLQQAGVEVLAGPWFADYWPEWLGENGNRLDYVFLSRPHIAPKYMHSIRTQTAARVLYYVHDLQYLREQKLADLQHDPALATRAEKTRIQEQELMCRMDTLFSCSDSEAKIIRRLCPEIEVSYVPPYAVQVDSNGEFRLEDRTGLLFVGGFSHPPNADGVLWFVREVWPDVKKRLPGAVFRIAGSGPPPEVQALASEDIQVLGFVSDSRLKELYHTSRLAVIPLRYGAGVKGKTVEAMALGVPVVTTEWGVEGMPGVEEILDPLQVQENLADGIVELYDDAVRLRGISRRQRDYVALHFTAERIQEAFRRVVSSPAALDGSGRTVQ